MVRIDCETRESALNTVAYFYNLRPQEIEEFLLGIDESEVDREYRRRCWFYEALRIIFEETFGGPAHEISEVCWFHLTRTLPGTTFEAGILPLGEVIDEMWNTLLKIFKDTEHHDNLLKLKEDGVREHHYGLKVPDPLHWGPHAMLVRDIAFCPRDAGHHDYLQIPEIMEDICNGYAEAFQVHLHTKVSESLKPCIVKFFSNKQTEAELFTPILLYLYQTARGEPLSDVSNDCFDGEASKVPASNILKVEFL